jgi:para-nitrobenzyl esterase
MPELLQAAWTDWAFRMPTLRLLEAHAGHSGRTYAYEFTWPSPTQPKLGATHTIDMPFVNHDLARWIDAYEGPDDLLGPDPPKVLADVMHQAWIDFATHGDPGWSPYDSSRRTTMRFDAVSGPVDDLAGAERRLWPA